MQRICPDCNEVFASDAEYDKYIVYCPKCNAEVPPRRKKRPVIIEEEDHSTAAWWLGFLFNVFGIAIAAGCWQTKGCIAALKGCVTALIVSGVIIVALKILSVMSGC